MKAKQSRTAELHVIGNHASRPARVKSSNRGEERQIASMFQHLRWQIFVWYGAFCSYKSNAVIVFDSLWVEINDTSQLARGRELQ